MSDLERAAEAVEKYRITTHHHYRDGWTALTKQFRDDAGPVTAYGKTWQAAVLALVEKIEGGTK